MERPALQKLLDDVRARKLDVIVVYKVDRLTRSLADFAKLVELFDAHGVSFISVTQAFNTTTSLGRLTLNMLLVLRSVRARDHRRANPRQGRRLEAEGDLDGRSGSAGYRVEDRALHVVEDEAEFVRSLFRRYLEIGSVVSLKTAFDAEPSLAGPHEQDRQKERRRPDLARPPLLDPVELDLRRTAAPQRADPRRPSSGNHRHGILDRVSMLESQSWARRISQPDDHSSSPASSTMIAETV